MKTFSDFRNTILESSSFGALPSPGQLDTSGRPCVYLGRSTGGCQTPVSEDYDDWKNEHQDQHLEVGRNLHDDQGNEEYDDKNPDHKAIRKYTDSSHGMNERLYRSHMNGQPDTRKLPLDSALEKHKLKRDLDVYSGTSFNPGKIAAKHPDNILHLPAFTSTSIERDVAGAFSQKESSRTNVRNIIHFHLKKGQTGKYIGQNDNIDGGREKQLSNVPAEHEFILPRDTTVKLHPHPDIHEGDNGETIQVWHAHPIDHKG